jgi:hypothetical protein
LIHGGSNASDILRANSEVRVPAYIIVTEMDPPHGDLFELEQTTWHRVMDTSTGDVVMEFRSDMAAHLSREDGMWTDHRFTGVSAVVLAPDGQSVFVKYCDGVEEMAPIPC